MTEVTPRLAKAETDVQRLVEANTEALPGVRFPASEYSTGPVHAGRIDSLGPDASGAPVVECTCGTVRAPYPVDRKQEERENAVSAICARR
ncbi:hypothetical protein [Streptomyces sp. NPDC093089]|uniref:hypothetical protein n=1 Tax=Streptomyces sp. NPDC093089 TaxID=3366024 RepID=UPI00380518FC